MRALVVHNRYSSRVPSGENLAVDDEAGWLRDAGVDVHVHGASNDDVVAAGPARRARQAADAVWSIPAARQAESLIAEVEPDVVHVHNLFPLLTGSVVRAALRQGVPVVWTVHNHRVVCVRGTYSRDGERCVACRPGWRVPGIRYGCYGESAAASALVTGATSVFRRLARRGVTAIAISDHVQRWLTTTAGFEPGRVRLKYNGVADPPEGADVPPAAGNRVFLFAGHVAEHKGIRLLLDAWRRADLPNDVELRIVGDGPLRGTVEAAAARDPRITVTGQLPPAEVQRQLAAARTVVVPSVWEEPFGRNAAEALAYGRPVVTTGLGGLREVVDDACGWLTGINAGAFAEGLTLAARSDAEVAERGDAARTKHRERFSPRATTRALVDIYTEAVSGVQS